MADEFIPNPNLIRKELADRSHAFTSFEPEKRAVQEIQGFADHVQNVYDELKKYAKTVTQKAFLITEMQRYQSGYAEKYNADLAAKGRTFSSMITGGSNFPTRRHEKANKAEQNRYEEMKAWDDRAQAAILRELKKLAVEEAGGEVEVLKVKIATAEQLQEKMKAANAIIRKNISPAEQIAQLINLGFDAARVHKLLQPDYMGRVGFPAFELTNNNANIRRMKERIGELEKKEATPSADIAFEGGTMHDSKEDDRIQLFFDQKPPQAMIDKLKGEGWRWSPSIGAWQRKRTDNALFSARRILGLEQQNPVFVPVKGELREEESDEPGHEQRDSTIVKKQVEALGVKVLRAKIDGYNSELIRLTVPTGTQPLPGEVRREVARGFNGLPIASKTWVWFKKPVPTKESPTLEKLQKEFEEKEIKPAFEVHDRLQKVINIIKIYRDKGLTFEDLLVGLKGAYLAQTDYVMGSNLNAQKLTDDLKKSGYANLRELWDKIITRAPEIKAPLLYPAPQKKLYRYYFLNRPPEVGTMPDNPIQIERWLPMRKTPLGYDALGWADYDRPLTADEIKHFELFVDEPVMPKLVAEMVKFAYDEGIDEAMKNISPDDEYYKAVMAWLKIIGRERPHVHTMAQVRDEIIRLAGVQEKDKSKEWKEAEKILGISFDDYELWGFGTRIKAKKRYGDTFAEDYLIVSKHLTPEEYSKVKPFLKGIEEARIEIMKPTEPFSPEYLNWLKVELHRSDDPIIAEGKKNKGFRLFVKSIDESKKEFVVEKDVYVNHANGIVSEMPGTEYNRGKKYPIENFGIMPFSEYLKKEGIKFQYKESLGFKYVRVHWNGGEGWQLEYQTDKKEYHSVNTKNFLTLDEINKLLNSGEAKLYVYDTRGEEFFRWKPFTVPYPEFKWHDYFTEKGKGKFYELLHAVWDNLTSIWMWTTSVTDAEKHYESQEISEPQLKASFVPIERWKVREQDLIKFLGEHDKPDFGGSSPHYIKDRIEDFKSQTLNKFPQAERDKYELILDTLKSRVRAKIEADKQPVAKKEVSEEDTAIKETFQTLKEAKDRKFQLEIKGYLIKEDIEEDHTVFGKPKFIIAYIPENKPAYKGFKKIEEKPKFVVENPFGVDLSKSVVPYPEQSKKEIIVDTSSKDYKAGYNLATQGRIAPAVPAWTDQGKADFAQGYKDGQKEFGKPVQVVSEKPKINLMQRLKEASTVIELQVLQREIKESSYPEAEKYELLSIAEGRLSAMGVEFKPKVIGAPSKQEVSLREAREKAHEGKKLVGQVSLGGAVSTSAKLGMFEPGAMEKIKAEAEARKRIEQAGLPYSTHPYIQKLMGSKESIMKFGSKRGRETTEDLVLTRYAKYCPAETIIDNKTNPKVPERWWVYPAKLRTCISDVEGKIAMISKENKEKLETARTDLESKLAEELRLKKELAEMQKMLGE